MKSQATRIKQSSSTPASFLFPAVSNLGRTARHVMLVASLALACLRPEAALAEGTVIFGNNSATKVINGQTGNPATRSDQIQAALYWAPQGSNTFSQLGAAITKVGFPLPGLFAGGTRTTPAATPGGATVQFQVRAWGGGFATYEQALANNGALIGQSAIIQMPTGNPGGAPPAPPNSLVAGGFQSFTLMPNNGRPTLSFTLGSTPGTITITWANASGGILRQADSVLGPWTDLPLAQSPYTTNTSSSQQFYLLRSP